MKPFIAFFILILLSTVEADLDEIKEKAQEYGAYDEVVANITEISYRGNIYYWVDFERVFQYSGSLLLDEDRNPVRDENVILAFARARMIHRGYSRKVVSEWFALASSYGETSRAISELKNSFEDKLVRSKIEVLANDFKALGELYSESALYLNRSLSFFSPDDAEMYMKKQDRIMEKLAYMQRECDAAIDAINASKDEHKDMDAIEVIDNYRESLNRTSGIIRSNRDLIDESAREMAEGICERVESKRIGSYVTQNLALWVAVFTIIFALYFLTRRLT